MTDRLNVAIVGCGGISRYHLANILKTPTMRLAATMDVIEAAARERADEGGAGYYTTDLDRVLSDATVDAVVICSTHDTHASISLEAIAAGKHVFVEKPPMMTVEEAWAVQKAVSESNVQFMGAWWFKHSPVTIRLREVIEKPYFILFTVRIPPAQNRRNKVMFGPDAAEGAHQVDDPQGPYGADGVFDNGGYALHWIWHVMRSQPVEIYAMGYGGKPTNTSTIVIRFENGSVANSVFSDVGSGGIVPKYYGEVLGGSVSAATNRFRSLVFEGTDEVGFEEIYAEGTGILNDPSGKPYRAGFDEEMEMFATLCLAGGTNPMDVWESSVPTLIFEKAIESMRERKPVSVDIREACWTPDGQLPESVATFGDGSR